MSFAKQFLIYGVAGAARRRAAIVLVPLYTRTLSIEAYGQLEVLLALHALVVIFGGLQVESAVARDYIEAKNRGHAQGLVWSAVWLTLAGTALATLALFCAQAVGWLPNGMTSSQLMLLIALTAPVQIFGIQLIILRFGGNAKSFAFFSFGDLTLCALFSYGFIVVAGLGIEGALWGILCGKLSCVLLAWSATFGKPTHESMREAYASRMLSYAIPTMPAVIVNWLQNAGSRLILAAALTLSDVAMAGLAIKVAAIYGFVIYSFRLAWEPYSMAKLTEIESDPTVYRRALEWYVATMLPIGGLAMVSSPYVVRMLAPGAYAPAASVAALFIAGQFWVGMTNMLVIGIHGARVTSRLLPVYSGGVLVNVGLMLATAPFIGAASAGVGFLGGSICSAVLARYFSNKHFRTGFTRRLIVWAFVSTVMFSGFWYQVLSGFSSLSTMSALFHLAIGLLLFAALTALSVRYGFDSGRPSAMWRFARESAKARLHKAGPT